MIIIVTPILICNIWNWQYNNKTETSDENDYVIVSGTDCEREPEFIPDGPKNALHHILQVRGHRLPEYSSVRDGESNWTATAILHISRHKTISVKVIFFIEMFRDSMSAIPTTSLFSGRNAP